MLKSFSYSAMNAYLKCGFAFKCRYIDGLPGRLTGDLIRGSAYHNALGMALAEKSIFGTPTNLETTLKCYYDTFDTSVKRRSTDDNGKIMEASDIDWGKDDPQQIREAGATVITKYYSEQLPNVQPREVEVWKRMNYRGIPLNGKIDVITKDTKVIDHKTAERSATETDIEKEIQSCVYAILMGLEELDFELHQAVIKKEPEIKIWPVHRSKKDIQWVGDLMVSTWSAIGQGIFLPSGLNGYWCSSKACLYWDICHKRLIDTAAIKTVAPLDF